jgi:osmotically-inducible protein OsmY
MIRQLNDANEIDQTEKRGLFASVAAICTEMFVGAASEAIFQTRGTSSAASDNTIQNHLNKNGDLLTPIKQSESRTDIELAARIRREITKDHALSITAENIKIISIEGHVTLRGPVKTEREKWNAEARAAAIAGSANVDDLLEISRH